MPHWPIYTGTVKSIDNKKVLFLLEHFKNPHLDLKGVFHIGGTNGKGSVCAFLTQILKESKAKVNRYTSPHLLECNERISINGSNISDNELFFYIESVRMVAEKYQVDLTIFEATTIAAFLAFKDNKSDFNIIEVGMGGLLDATNVFDKSENLLGSILHTVSLDHTDHLGGTISQIATHKVDIFKPQAKCISGPQTKEAMEVILKKRQDTLCFGRDYFCSKVQLEEDESFAFLYWFLNQENTILFDTPSLLGDHQITNASLAITAIKAAKLDFITDETIASALAKTHWKGRLEKISNSNILKIFNHSKNIEIWFDGAHNPAGAEVLSNWISQNNTSNNDFYLIVGKTKGTDVKSFAKPFFQKVISAFAVSVKGEIMPENPDVICEAFRLNKIASQTCTSLQEALMKISSKINKDKTNYIIVTGSLYLMRDLSWI